VGGGLGTRIFVQMYEFVDARDFPMQICDSKHKKSIHSSKSRQRIEIYSIRALRNYPKVTINCARKYLRNTRSERNIKVAFLKGYRALFKNSHYAHDYYDCSFGYFRVIIKGFVVGTAVF
jgi:hypothetical protein